MRSRIQRIGKLAAALFFFVMVVGCERGREVEAGDEAEATRVVQSQAWPEEAYRVVSMAPNITEALFALGLGDRVVAVTRYCDYPPQVEALPKIGGMLDPDLEAILAVEPDLVLGDVQGADHRIAARLDQAGVAYGFLEMGDIGGVRTGLELLGKWMGIEEHARKLREQFDRELAAASERVHSGLLQRGASAMIVYDQEPVVAAGPGSFGDELLQMAGLENALGADLRQYPVLDMEAVLSLNPAVIIDVSIGPEEAEVQRFWAGFESLAAVQRGQVVHIDDPVIMRPGPRLPQALDLLGKSLHEASLSAESP